MAGEIGRPRLLFLSVLTSGHFVVHWYSQLLSLSLPLIKAHLQLTDVQVGALVSAQYGLSTGAQLPSGYLSDSYPRLRLLLLPTSILAFGLAAFLLGSPGSYQWALVGAATLGLGSSLWHPSAAGSLSLQFPDRRGLAISVHGIGASIGDSVAPVAVGAVILAVAWQNTLQFHAIPAIILALVLWRFLAAGAPSQGLKPGWRSYVVGIKSMVTNAQILAVVASNSLFLMGRLAIVTFLPIYIKETLGYIPGGHVLFYLVAARREPGAAKEVGHQGDILVSHLLLLPNWLRRLMELEVESSGNPRRSVGFPL